MFYRITSRLPAILFVWLIFGVSITHAEVTEIIQPCEIGGQVLVVLPEESELNEVGDGLGITVQLINPTKYFFPEVRLAAGLFIENEIFPQYLLIPDQALSVYESNTTVRDITLGMRSVAPGKYELRVVAYQGAVPEALGALMLSSSVSKSTIVKKNPAVDVVDVNATVKSLDGDLEYTIVTKAGKQSVTPQSLHAVMFEGEVAAGTSIWRHEVDTVKLVSGGQRITKLTQAVFPEYGPYTTVAFLESANEFQPVARITYKSPGNEGSQPNSFSRISATALRSEGDDVELVSCISDIVPTEQVVGFERSATQVFNLNQVDTNGQVLASSAHSQSEASDVTYVTALKLKLQPKDVYQFSATLLDDRGGIREYTASHEMSISCTEYERCPYAETPAEVVNEVPKVKNWIIVYIIFGVTLLLIFAIIITLLRKRSAPQTS